MNREAPDTFNGFLYQRNVCIYYLLKEENIISITEEGDEDIDIQTNNNKKVVQVKYYKYGKNEAFNKDDGLFNVVSANYNKNDIDKIIYFFYNEKQFFSKNLKDLFDNKKFDILGKYFIIQYINSLKPKSKYYCKIQINNINKNSENINNCINEFKKSKEYIENKQNVKNVYNFFNNIENCFLFFNKIELIEGYSYDELKNKINELIKMKYPDFITNTKSNVINNIKIPLIYNTLHEILNDFIISNKDKKERTININIFNHTINEMINIYENTENILDEYLKQLEKQIEYPHKNNNLNLFKENVNYLQSHFNKDIILFYIKLLNKYNKKMDENIIINLKNNIINGSLSFIKNNNEFENNKKIISLLFNIIHYKFNKNKFKLPYKKMREYFTEYVDNNNVIKNNVIKNNIINV